VPTNAEAVNQALGEFRAYLECLTWIQVDPRLRSKFGLSDVVARTLWEAYQALDRLRGLDPEGQKRWLRKVHAHNLLDEIHHWKADCRDYRREQPLAEAVDESSLRLEHLLAAEDASPSEQLERQEQSLRVAEALTRLPEREREAIILQRFHGWKLAQIAEHLGCTTGAVAGLHARGLARLRQWLPEME